MRAAAIFAIPLLICGCAQAQELAASGMIAPPLPAPPALEEGRYRVSGAAELRPVQIGDDGVHTYIVWSDQQDLPAVFSVNAAGTEEMVDGYMRSGTFTIDRIHRKLVFRIDRKAAKAERVGK